MLSDIVEEDVGNRVERDRPQLFDLNALQPLYLL